MKIQIKARFTDAVLFECEISDGVEEKYRLREALVTAVGKKAYLRGAYLGGADLRGAYLRGADLRGAYLGEAYLGEAYLGGADLRGAYLRGADLGGADLRGAYLRGADLRGAYLREAYLRGADLGDIKVATPEDAVANLDRVREIILDGPQRLDMGHWHDDDSKWKEHTCAEEALCGTTHCLAGWLQVCSTDEAIRKLDPNVAGIVLAPVASKMFFESESRVKAWLEKREYATVLK